VAGGFEKNLLCPFVTADGLTLYGVVGERSGEPGNRFTAWSRKSIDRPFSDPMALGLPEIQEFTGWYPRPVEASHELFFCSQRLSPSGDMDIRLVRDFKPADGSSASLSGAWLAFTEEASGKRVAKEEMLKKKKSLKVDGERFTLSTTGYKITGTARPADAEGANAVDFVGRYVEGGNGKSVLLRAIYEVRNDTLRLCYSYNDATQHNKRPSEFETDEGRPGMCVTFRKAD
jgi:uncharacterized protein (TIGR03067 family)